MGESVGEERAALTMFKDTPGCVKTLRQSYKEQISLSDQVALKDELMGESVRASIILISTLLEDALKLRIAKCLCFEPEESEFKKIFRFEGPLGTFSAQMELACLFGFIEDVTYAQLNLIREMRNACAHSRHSITYDNSALANVAKRLIGLRGFITDPRLDELKGAVIGEGIFLYQALLLGSREEATKIILAALKADAGHAPSPDKPK